VRSPFSVSASGVALAPESGTWYRALQVQFIPTALSTRYTSTVSSRFSGASPASSGFEILYLAENHLVALLEVQALLGSPTTPGGLVPHPQGTYATLNVSVSLQHVADLTDLASQSLLDTTAQELTGDWRGYRLRGPGTSVQAPTGMAPTQDLGAALYGVPRLEGFKSLSAKAPYHRLLAIFPQKLLPGSQVSWFNPQTGKHESLPTP
jgi:RES domain-containing protein